MEDMIDSQPTTATISTPVSSINSFNLIPIPTKLSTNSLLAVLHRINESICRLQHQRVAQEELDERGARMLEAIRVVVEDFETFLQSKDQDETIQQILMQLMALFGELRGNPTIEGLTLIWKDTFAPFLNDWNIHKTFFFMKSVWSDLQRVGSVFTLISESLRLLEYILSDSQGSDFQATKAGQRDRMFDQLLIALRAVSTNTRWQEAWARRGERHTNQQPFQRGEILNSAYGIAHSSWWASLVHNLKHLLKAIVGPQNGVVVDNFWNSLRATYNDLEKTPGYHDFLADALEVLAEIIEDPPVLEHPANRHVLRTMYNTFLQMVEELKAQNNLRQTQQDAHMLTLAIRQDAVTKQLLDHLADLLHELGSGARDGHLFDLDLISQFRHLFVPFMVETFRDINIPPIQGSTDDKKVKYHIHGVVLSSLEILPENIHVEVTYKTNNDPLRLSLHEVNTVIWIEAEKIKARVKGAAWSYERVAFPKMKDEGLASVVLGGHGARVGVKLKIRTSGKERKTKLEDSYCVIDRLDIALYECKHTLVYGVCHSAIARGLKKALEKSIAEKLAQVVDLVDRRMALSVQHAKSATLHRNVGTVGAPLAETSSEANLHNNIPKKRRLRNLVTKARVYAEDRARIQRKPVASTTSQMPATAQVPTTTAQIPTTTAQIPTKTTTTLPTTTTTQLPTTAQISTPVALPPAPSAASLSSSVLVAPPSPKVAPQPVVDAQGSRVQLV